MRKITIFSLVMGYGGIEKYISKLCFMLYKQYDIEIICTYKEDNQPAFDFPKEVSIQYLVNKSPSNESIKLMLKQFRIISALKIILKRIKLNISARRLNKKAIKNIDTDIIITTRNYHHSLVSKYINKKDILLVATEHNFHQYNKKYIKNLVNSVKKFDYLVVPTKELHDYYKNNIGNCKCVRIPHPLDYIPKEKTDFKHKNIISVGRFSQEKGILDLIDVFKLVHKKLPKTKLYLIGDGYQRERINGYVNDNGLSNYIVMPGFKPYEEQKAYYMNSSLFVMTSYTEAFGLVLIEAMSYGVPCIAFDSASGPRELINKEIGILIHSRDKEKMADSIVSMINNKELLKKYQNNLFNYINQFDINNIKKQYLKILK